jgi:hypothetical protein
MAQTTSRSTWILLIGILALVAVGCGGDDSSSGDDGSSDDEASSEPLDEEEFLAQFDEVCIEVSEDLDDLAAPETNEELAEQAGEAIDIASQGIDDLSEITPPEDLQDTVDELLGVLEDRVELFEELQAAAEDDDDDAIEELSDDNADLESEVDELGEELGIDCFVDDGDASDDLTSDFSDDASSDFSDDLSDDFSDGDIGVGASPEDAIAEYGSDPDLDALADACYALDYGACDDLYAQSAAGSGYEAYGDTCGGLQEQGTGQFCEDVFG